MDSTDHVVVIENAHGAPDVYLAKNEAEANEHAFLFVQRYWKSEGLPGPVPKSDLTDDQKKEFVAEYFEFMSDSESLTIVGPESITGSLDEHRAMHQRLFKA